MRLCGLDLMVSAPDRTHDRFERRARRQDDAIGVRPRPPLLVPAGVSGAIQGTAMVPGAAASASSGAFTPLGRTITGQLASATTRRDTPPRSTARSGP